MTRHAARLIAFVAISWPAMLAGQPVTVDATGDLLHIRAPGFGVLKGDAMNRLKNGQTIRFDFDLTVFAQPGAQPAIQARQRFVLSYDLWEERFAVTLAGSASRSISHLTAPDAESWCLEQMTISVSEFARLGRGAPFWIRLEYRIEDGNGATSPKDTTGYSLRGLIDVLSRRRRDGELRDSLDAGPFRLSR